MSGVDILSRPRRATPEPVGRSPRTVVARWVGRRAIRSVVAWAFAFALYVVGSISGFASTYKTAAARAQLARSLESNTGFTALLGPARHIDTVAGFAAWRCLVILSVIGGVWALLTATRLLRAEEEEGRWELLIAGQTTRRRATAQGLAGLGVGWAVLLGITAMITVADGRSVQPALPVSASLFFSLALTASAAMFLALGAFTSQLARTRRRAASIAGGVLGAAYLLRIVADSSSSLPWLRWASPLGWVEELRPFTGSHLLALVPIAAFVLVLGGLSVYLAGARDLGASVLPESDSARPRTALLNSPTRLAVRLVRPVALTWLFAIAALGFVGGLVAKGAAPAVNASPTARQAIARLGAHSFGAAAYLGLFLLTAAAMIALVAAGQSVAAREEEATERLDHLLVCPVSRLSWLAGRLGVGAVVLVVGGLVLGLSMWAGAASQHSGVRFGSLVAAGVSAAPPALFLLGFGALVHGAAPRLVTAATYGLVTWSFLVEFIAAVVKLSHWVLDTSLLYHLAPAPAAAPHWGSAAGLVGLGLLCALAGGAAFRRRDLVGA